MARDLPSTEPSGKDDALALFGAEAAADASVGGSGPVLAQTPPVVSIEAISTTSALRFVEGVAVVQALTAAIKAKGGVSAGMPDLQGVFLTPAGEVVAISPLGSNPAAPELARLLHRIVPADVTPPVGRLFIDRWVNSESNDLTQFVTELDYFARPNGRELLAAVHARHAGTAESTPASAPPVVPPIAGPEVSHRPTPSQETKVVAEREQHSRRAWMLEHRRQLAAAAVIIVSTVVVTALGSWFWPTRTAAAATGPALTVPIEAEAAPEPGKAPTARIGTAAPPSAPRGRRTALQPRQTDATVAWPEIRETTVAAPAPPANSFTTGEAPVPALLSRNGPDMTIYSGNDPGVEAPTLRSNEIPELLISGFPARTNFVEVVVSTKGEVETVKMVGPPQRMPDIMLLSRLKEWAFVPATKDGRAVRYRLTLSWNVTP
jgi:hypothetical protein